MKISDLENLGFSKKEARAYLACLELGSGTAFQTAKKLGVPKSTTFDLLSGLVARGLLSTYVKKNKKFFSAGDPDALGEKPKRELEAFEKILPELKALAFKGAGKPIVRYFDTKVGIEVAIKEMFAEAEDLMVYGNVDAVFAAYPEYFPKYTKGRVRKGIPTRALLFDGPVAQKLKSEDVPSIRRTKITPPTNDASSLFWIWKNKFVIFNAIGDHSVLIVEDRRFTMLTRSMFELMWNSVA
jgi:sugar-specific transcriptional regulator TrmB